MLIENKIFAAVYNPFDDYAAYLSRSKNDSGDSYRDENKRQPRIYAALGCVVNLD